MKRIAIVVLLLAALAHATTNVTGKIQNLGTGNVTSGAFARFWLRGCRGNQPRVNGFGVIGPSQGGVYFFDIPADSGGNVTGTIYSTRDSTGLLDGDIECGGTHTSEWYGLQFFLAGKGGPEFPIHAKSGGALDITNVTPLLTNPVIIPPAGDNTYLRLDAGNVPFLGNLTPNGTGLLSLGISANRWNMFASTLDASSTLNVSGNSTLGGTLNVSGFGTVSGLQVKVSGTACGQTLDLFNIDATPTNPHKYFRVNQATGALEIMNSACGSIIASIDDAGNVTFPGTSAGATLGGGTSSFTATPNTFMISSLGTINLSNHFPGNPLTLATPNGIPGVSLSALGGTINFTTGANCAIGPVCSTTGTPYGFGQLSSNSYFSSYNGLPTAGMGLSPQVAAVDLTSQTAAIGTTTLYTTPTYAFPLSIAVTAQEYRLSWNAKVTTAATGAATSTLGALTIVYTDPDGVVQTITAPASIAAGTIATTSTGNSTTTVLLGMPLTLNCKAATTITYAMAYASNAANTMAYNLHIRLEAH